MAPLDHRLMLTRNNVHRLYDKLAPVYDRLMVFEGRAKSFALENLQLSIGNVVLDVGLGTGKELEFIQRRVGQTGKVVGLDISDRMLRKARRTPEVGLCQADGEFIPFVNGKFDRLYCAYVLDLVPLRNLDRWLDGFLRVVKPGGRVVLVSLTEGENKTSKLVVWIWKTLYEISPMVCGGCRPLQLTRLASMAGFRIIHRKVVVQLGLPSEVLTLEVGNNPDIKG